MTDSITKEWVAWGRFDCPECGEHIEEDVQWVRYGNTVDGDYTVTCPNCGAEVPDTPETMD